MLEDLSQTNRISDYPTGASARYCVVVIALATLCLMMVIRPTPAAADDLVSVFALALDADAYLRAVFTADGVVVDPLLFCHRPVVVSDPYIRLGSVISLFKADAPAKNVAVSYEADCMGCHVPAAKTDRVFIQGYPTLTQH